MHALWSCCSLTGYDCLSDQIRSVAQSCLTLCVVLVNIGIVVPESFQEPGAMEPRKLASPVCSALFISRWLVSLLDQQGEGKSQSDSRSVEKVDFKREWRDNPHGDQCWVFIGRTDAEAETAITLATWCEELTRWKRPWCWEGLGTGGEGDDRGRDGWMASPIQWTWVWVNSESWWWTGRPGVLRFMGSQRVRHDWATELNWRDNERKTVVTRNGWKSQCTNFQVEGD